MLLDSPTPRIHAWTCDSQGKADDAGMELFSGLKKAYDAVGAEINRTFDSSLAEEGAEPEERSPTPEAVVRGAPIPFSAHHST